MVDANKEWNVVVLSAYWQQKHPKHHSIFKKKKMPLNSDPQPKLSIQQHQRNINVLLKVYKRTLQRIWRIKKQQNVTFFFVSMFPNSFETRFSKCVEICSIAALVFVDIGKALFSQGVWKVNRSSMLVCPSSKKICISNKHRGMFSLLWSKFLECDLFRVYKHALLNLFAT